MERAGLPEQVLSVSEICGEGLKNRPGSFTLMPWLPFCQMPEEDLKAIFAFLKTQPPVYNAVKRTQLTFSPSEPVS
jgi:hypothetical protein